MEKKHRSIIALALILCIAIGRICYYTLPVELRTFGDNDTFVWDSDDLRFLQAKDENWYSALENLLINEEKPPKRVAFLLS